MHVAINAPQPPTIHVDLAPSGGFMGRLARNLTITEAEALVASLTNAIAGAKKKLAAFKEAA